MIVVDNHSTDATTSLLAAGGDPRLIHLIPEETDLGIGGCWDKAIRSERCGKYAVQLDSDDLYSSPHTLQRIVDEMEQKGAAMCIGAYRMVNFQLETLPPASSTTASGPMRTAPTMPCASTASAHPAPSARLCSDR